MRRSHPLASLLGLSLLAGAACNQNAPGASAAPTAAAASTAAAGVRKKIVVMYWRSTCEAPTYAAKLKGFFEKEGIDADLVVARSEDLLNQHGKLMTADGREAQVAMFFPLHLVMMLQGAPLDYILTAGLHQGCMQTLALKDS